MEPYVEILDLTNGAVSGTWSFGDGFKLPYVLGTEIGHSYQDTGTYTVTLVVKNEGGCISTHSEDICVEAVTTLFEPNALSPNDDGQNDYFQFVGTGIQEIFFQIYDRWGTLLFEGDSMDDRWDGQYRGKPMPQGAYVYKVRYKTVYQEGYQERAGTVMILR